MDALERFHKGDRHFPELEPDDTRSAGTALFDAMYLTAMEKLRPIAGERKALILFSDGEDNSSAHDLMDAIEAAQDRGLADLHGSIYRVEAWPAYLAQSLWDKGDGQAGW